MPRQIHTPVTLPVLSAQHSIAVKVSSMKILNCAYETCAIEAMCNPAFLKQSSIKVSLHVKKIK